MTYSYESVDRAERERTYVEVDTRITNIRQKLALKAKVLESLARQMAHHESPRDVRGTAGILRQLAVELDKLSVDWDAANAEANRT